MNKPIFRSAITDENGDVDVGYLALIWGLIGWGVSVLFVLVIGAYVAWREPTDGAATIQAMGIAVGAVSGGFATMLGAVGFFRFGDRDRMAAGSTRTTRETVTESAPVALTGTVAKPMPVAVVDMPASSAPPVRARKAKGKR